MSISTVLTDSFKVEGIKIFPLSNKPTTINYMSGLEVIEHVAALNKRAAEINSAIQQLELLLNKSHNPHINLIQHKQGGYPYFTIKQ